jgi:A/G-specific adenine glycosylase
VQPSRNLHAVDDAERQRFQSAMTTWASVNARVFPWRETSDPFLILLAEVLLQRSRGKTVARVFTELERRWPDADSLSRARVGSIETTIRPLGLVRRATTIKTLAREVARIGMPTSLEGLMSLPGVGKYTASATFAAAFGVHVPVVDGVTARVYRRYFGIESHRPASADHVLWDLVAEVTPTAGVRGWNWAVLDLAASVCLPKVPRCGECPLSTGCAWSRARAAAVAGTC